jgi:hypothetical protein
MTPWLSPDDVNDLCEPLTQKAAQCAFLKTLGLTVKRKPDGSPLVMRSNLELVLGAIANPATANPEAQGKSGPNKTGLLLFLNKKG